MRGERCARCDGRTATAGSPDTGEGRGGTHGARDTLLELS